MKMTVQQWLTSPEKPDLYKPFPFEGDICIGTVLYSEAEQKFKINMGFEYGTDTYDIAADQILSATGLLDFLWQVHGKEWVTAQNLKDLLDCITCYVYRDHNQQLPQVFFDVASGMSGGLDQP